MTPRSLDPSTVPRRVALHIAYDGTDYLGWQRQARGSTVQSVLETMLGRLAGDVPVSVVGAGRTDSGVHAAGQVAHADIATIMDDAALLHALRRMSPDDIAVRDLVTTAPDFHARYSAWRRSYRYTLLKRPDPFRARYAWLCDGALDANRLNAAARALAGAHDFTALSKHNPDTPNAVCEVVSAQWSEDDGAVYFDVTADRFLYGMVRLLVGLQLDVGRGRRDVDDVAAVLESRDRSQQSQAVPARGLSLVSVGYPNDPFRRHGDPDIL